MPNATTSIKRQQGAVLLVALIILLVLTLLGVAALNTTTLEEKMALNNQETQRAFQAAEAGISEAFGDPGTYFRADDDDCSEADGVDGTAGPFGTAGANIITCLVALTNPPVGSMYSQEEFASFHFETRSDAGSNATLGGGVFNFAGNAARMDLVGGAFVIGPR